MARKVILLMSGGVESTTLAVWLQKRKKYDVQGLYFNYGQPWTVEEAATVQVAEHLKIPLTVFNMDALPGIQLEVGEFNMGFLAMRNPILLSIAINFAFALGVDLIAHGAEQSVHPDCSPEFVDRFNFMVEKAMEGQPVYTITPFVHMTKTEVVKEAARLRAPMNLTWSCMKNTPLVNCGTCPSCEWRLMCFKEAKYKDPAPYAIEVDSGKRPFPTE